MNKNYLYILDYSNCTLNCLHLNVEDLIRYWGFNPDECAWMFSSVKLNINDIFKPLKN